MSSFSRRLKRDRMELPDELTSEILSRLGVTEILYITQKVCMKWREICKDPLFWRKIDMCDTDDDRYNYYDYYSLFRLAVHRSSGNVVDINIDHFATDHLLCFITRSCASRLRRIRLYSCKKVSDEGLRRMALNMPLLEEVDITLCVGISHQAVEAIGRSCPLLRSFKFNKECCSFSDDEHRFDLCDTEFNETNFNHIPNHSHYAPFGPARRDACFGHDPVSKDDNADAIAIAATMQGLRHLQLYGNKLTDDGLRQILDSCPHLESLDLRLCLNVNMGMDLETRCAQRIKRLWLPHDSVEERIYL